MVREREESASSLRGARLRGGYTSLTKARVGYSYFSKLLMDAVAYAKKRIGKTNVSAQR